MNAILVINSGSSTIKFSIFAINDNELDRKYKGVIDKLLTKPFVTFENVETNEKISKDLTFHGEKEEYYRQAIEYILYWAVDNGFKIVAAGHRVVHGGPHYFQPVVLDDFVIRKLSELFTLMPLHQPYNVKGAEILRKELPDTLQVACFDSGFHVTCDPIAQVYALPKRFREDGIRRYGFHGLSYEYVASQLPLHMSEQEANGKIIVAHLGNGATMCVMENRQSFATSIGFTAVGGLPMGTRCDSIDPGTVLYLQEKYGYTTDQVRNIFYRESGLLGMSGISADMRELLASDSKDAKLAVDVFVHSICRHAGMLAGEIQGVDAFVFTGGIGENASPIREMACEKMRWLGIELDKEKNNQRFKEATKISSNTSKVPVWVIPTDEEVMIAKHTFRLLKA
jgi:acetate kinase